MALPYFYVASLQDQFITLDEDTSKHMIGVLRMEKGEQVLLTDGKGGKATVEITDAARKRCAVAVLSLEEEVPPAHKVVIAVSLVKTAARYEWFLEKATEIGVTGVIPLICDRTEKEKFRYDRMQQLLISAMLQSQQCRMPLLHQPTAIKEVIGQFQYDQQFIAHCREDRKEQLSQQLLQQKADRIILIGPEGDFTSEEINLALVNNFIPVALGGTRLRTETAGVVAAALLCQL